MLHVPSSVSCCVCHRRLHFLYHTICLCFSFSYININCIISIIKKEIYAERQHKLQSLCQSTLIEQATAVAAAIMCIKIVERYAVCRCIYYSHAIDACPAYGRRGHNIKTQEVLVGYTCSRHTVNGFRSGSSQQYNYPDSGYASGSTGGRNADGSFRR